MLCGAINSLVFQLLKLPTSEAAYSHLSLLIQRLVRLMAVEHQVRKSTLSWPLSWKKYDKRKNETDVAQTLG